MADENKDTTKTEGTPPGLTEDKVREMIASGVQDALKDIPTPPTTPTTHAQADVDPLDAVIRPRVEKIVGGPLIAALAEADKVSFYNHPTEGVLRRKHEKDVEALFTQGLKDGRAYKREDHWSFYRGQNFDKFVEDAARAKAAEGEVSVGAGSPARDTSNTPGAFKDPFAAKPEELEKALDGVSF
jgi:hypothetical protein